MKTQEIAIYREIQKNAEKAVKAIDTLSELVYDREMSLQMSRQALTYTQLRGEAVSALLEAKEEPYHENQLEDMALKAGIRYNTLLNTSAGHIAEVMIRENNREVIALEKVLKHNDAAGAEPVLLARKMLDLEEQNIARLKDYL